MAAEELGFNPEDYNDEDFEGEDRVGDDLGKKALRLYELRERRDKSKTQASLDENDYRAFEQEYYAALEASPILSAIKYNLGDYGHVTFGLRSTIYSRMLDAKKFREHLRAKGIEEQYLDDDGSLNKGRVNELVRDCLETQTPIPPGLDYTINNGVTISVEKGTAKAEPEDEEDSDAVDSDEDTTLGG